jgi:hypothetical protein
VTFLLVALSGCSGLVNRALYPDGEGPCAYLPESEVARILGAQLKLSYGTPLPGGVDATDWFCTYDSPDRKQMLSFHYRCFEHEATATREFADHAGFLYLRDFSSSGGLGDGAHWVAPDTRSGLSETIGAAGLLSVRTGREVFVLRTQGMGGLPLARARSLAEVVLTNRGAGRECYKVRMLPNRGQALRAASSARMVAGSSPE